MVKKEKPKNILPVRAESEGATMLSFLEKQGGALLSEFFEALEPGIYTKRLKKASGKELRKREEKNIRTTLWRLEQKGLVSKNKKQYHLTAYGSRIVHVFQGGGKEWDGKWRMVIFDIPERNRHDRNWLRGKLLSMEYKPLQRSVFIGRYPLEEETYEGLLEKRLIQFVRLMTIGEIDAGLDDLFRDV